MAEDNATNKTILLSTIIAGIVTIIVNLLLINYQSHKEYKTTKEPLVSPIDYTKNENTNFPFSNSNHQIFFNLSLRNVTITKITLKVLDKKQDSPLYRMFLFEGGGGGGGGDIPQCNTAFVNIDENHDNYILLDISNAINKFKKESLPIPVTYENKLYNEFFKISFRSNVPSFKFSIMTEVEWKGIYNNDSKNNNINTLKLGPHKFAFLNPIEIKNFIPDTINTISINGLDDFRKNIQRYFNGSNKNKKYKLIFTDNGHGKFITFDNNKVLYYNYKHSKGRELYFDEKCPYERIIKI